MVGAEMASAVQTVAVGLALVGLVAALVLRVGGVEGAVVDIQKEDTAYK